MSDDIRHWIEENLYARDLGVRLHQVDATSATFSLLHHERNTMAGTLHGGALAALVSIGGRAMARIGSPDRATRPRTLSMHVVYARAARKSLTVETRLVRRVKELCFFETVVKDEEGHEIVTATSVVTSAPVVSGESERPIAAALDTRERLPSRFTQAEQQSLHTAMASIPFVARRQLAITEIGHGSLSLSLGPTDVNLDGDGAMDEGAALTLVDAAGATCPWTIVSPTSGAAGATVGLSAQVLRPLPVGGLTARAAIRARDEQVDWTEITILDSRAENVHLSATVAYRFSKGRP